MRGSEASGDSTKQLQMATLWVMRRLQGREAHYSDEAGRNRAATYLEPGSIGMAHEPSVLP